MTPPLHCESKHCAKYRDGDRCGCGCEPCEALNPQRAWHGTPPASTEPAWEPEPEERVAPLKAPFPWFGGKSRVADIVWRAFGNVPNYVEPFFGSGAVLLGRPHVPKIETVNDADAYVSNFWRAVASDPEAVAQYCDWPVNEVDLYARHRWLVGRAEFREQLMADPEHFDARIAGWWVWGLSQWIGGGWCQVPTGTDTVTKTPNLSSQSGNGTGVHRKMPDLYTRGKGVHIQVPRLQGSGSGSGVNASSRLPSLGNERGILGADAPPRTEWFRALQARLRRVRVVAGDWTRVLGDSVLGTTKSRNSGMNPCGVFLDPPYGAGERDAHLYAVDDGTIAAKVAEWARAHGDDKDLRIALCGYEGEHEMPASWTCVAWKANRGYGGDANENRHRERILVQPALPAPFEDPGVSLQRSAARGDLNMNRLNDSQQVNRDMVDAIREILGIEALYFKETRLTDEVRFNVSYRLDGYTRGRRATRGGAE